MEGLSMAAGQELGRGMNEQRECGRRQTQRSFVFAYQLEITNNTAALRPSLCMCVYVCPCERAYNMSVTDIGFWITNCRAEYDKEVLLRNKTQIKPKRSALWKTVASSQACISSSLPESEMTYLRSVFALQWSSCAFSMHTFIFILHLTKAILLTSYNQSTNITNIQDRNPMDYWDYIYIYFTLHFHNITNCLVSKSLRITHKRITPG